MADLSLKRDFVDKGLMKDLKAWCFGKDPVVSPIQVAFAAGAKMFSVCAAITFTCPKVEQNNVFKLVFCAKLHSKIFRKDPTNRSSWFIWQPIGKSGCMVWDTDKFESMTGIKIYDVVRTPEFKQLQQTFKKILAKGIDEAAALRKDVSREDEDEYSTYIKSLQEAQEIIGQMPVIMDKSYKLVDYDRFTDELKKQGYSDELHKRGDMMMKRNKDVGKKFVDKVKHNALKTGEQERNIQHDLKKQEQSTQA